MFTTAANSNGYQQTHYTDMERLGEYKPGTYYTLETVDNTMYASPFDTYTSAEHKVLTKDDYYYDYVSVMRTDLGHDPWEDTVGGQLVEKVDGFAYTTKILAQFAKKEDGTPDNSGEWVEVAALVNAWEGKDENEMRYTFTKEDLQREPYGVKVVQTSTNYETQCLLTVRVKIRGTSPCFGWKDGYSFSEHGEDRFVTVRDESHMNSYASDGSIIMKDVKDFGDSWLYPVLRGAETKKVQKSAGSDENTATSYVRYNLSEYDGYFVDSPAGVTKLREMGLINPGKKTVIFYDLLPYAMAFDPSMEVVAGRVVKTSDMKEVGQEKGWNRKDVTVIPEVVTSDYNGTGRQLLKFTLTYSGEDYSLILRRLNNGEEENMWAESWGVSFGAHYSWADADLVKTATNYSAFMLANNDEHIVGDYVDAKGEHGTIYYDNGGDNGLPKPNPFAPDLDGDGKTGIHGTLGGDEIMYAFSEGSDELVTASESRIVKAVRADEEPYAPFTSEAVVTPGRTYTYDINVKTATESLKHITMFDNMEIASYIRRLASESGNAADESYYNFEDTFWHGTFADIITTSLDKQCPGYKIYYSANRVAQKPQSGVKVADMAAMSALLEGNGWEEASAFAQTHGEKWREQVCAVAVILPDNFVLEGGKSVGFRIKMTAPPVDLSDDLDDDTYKKYVFGVTKDSSGYNTTDYGPVALPAEYSYNNSAFYSEKYARNSKDPIYQCVTGNSVRVSEKQDGRFEIVKQFDPQQVAENRIPEILNDEEFTFTIYHERPDPTKEDGSILSERYSYKTYTLWEKAGNDWKQIDENKVHATNSSGRLTLKANQKAVFAIPAGYLYNNEETLTSHLRVEEEENIFWETAQAFDGVKNKEAVRGTVTVTNTYQSALYVTKNLLNVPKDMTEEERKGYEFTLRLLDKNGNPVAQRPYVMVDEAMSGYVSPTILPMPADKDGKTNQNGEFTIRWGEVIAFVGLELGENYTVEELPLPEDTDWVIDKGKITVEAAWDGATAKIQNRYRWKEIYLTKALTRTERLDLKNEPVTFKFLLERKDADGKWVGVSGKEWVMTDEKHNVITAEDKITPAQSGVTDADGTFAVTLDETTRYFKLMKLEEKTDYRISEVTDKNGNAVNILGESTDFEALSPAQIVTMPIYATGKAAAFKNEYRLRPIQVKKLVASSNSADKSKLFKMKIEVGEVDGTLKNYEYRSYKVYDGKGKEVTPTSDNTLERELGVPLFRTDGAGNFLIKDDWTVIFDDVGREGEKRYRITETDRNGLEQLIPQNNGAAEGTLASNGALANFVNGTKGTLLIGKEFSPTTEEAEKLVELLNDVSWVEKLTDEERDRFRITVTFDHYIAAQVVDTIGLSTAAPVSKKDFVWKLYPWERLIINNTYTYNFTVTEGVGDQKWTQFYEVDNSSDSTLNGLHISVQAKTPQLSIAPKEDGIKLLVNELEVHKRGSVIRKAMSAEDIDPTKPVEAGAKLVMQVERWNGTRWAPAEGVSYFLRDEADPDSVVFDEPVLVGEKALTTAADGLITVVKSENDALWPVVYFDDVVRIPDSTNPALAEPEVGTLRIMEVPELSDTTWGRFIGKTVSDGADTPQNVPQDTFINSNLYGELALTKDVTGKVDLKQEFTFLLEHILEYEGTMGEEDFRILHSDPANDIPYTVFEDGKAVDSGVTGTKGEIKLKGGQTAKLTLPEGTVWAVSEVQDTPYKLTDIDETVGVYRNGENQVVFEIEKAEREVKLLDVSLDWGDVNEEDRNIGNKLWFNQQYGLAPGDALTMDDLKIIGTFTNGQRVVTAEDIEGLRISYTYTNKAGEKVPYEGSFEPVKEDDVVTDYRWVCPTKVDAGANVTSEPITGTVTVSYLVDGEPIQTEPIEIKLLPRYLFPEKGSYDYLRWLYVPMCYADDAVKAAEVYSDAAVDASALGYAEKADHLVEFDCGKECSPLKVYPRVAKSSEKGDNYFYFAFNSPTEGRQLKVYARKDDPSVALIPETSNVLYSENYPGSKALGVYSFRGDDVKVTAAEGAVVYTNEQTFKKFNTYSSKESEKVFNATVTDIWLPNEKIEIKPANDSFLKGYASNTLIVHCNEATMKYMVGEDGSGETGTFAPTYNKLTRKYTYYIDVASTTDLRRAFKVYQGATIQGFKTSASQSLYFVVYDEDPRTNPDVPLRWTIFNGMPQPMEQS